MKFRPSVMREALLQQATPSLLFDFEAIEANLKMFRRVTSAAGATWSYAVKSLARREVLEMAASYADGFDVSNIAEWNKIVDFVGPSQVIWVTNGNLERELSAFREIASSNQVIITINDLSDFELVKSSGLNFVIRLSSSMLVHQASSSRFGLDREQLGKIEPELARNPCFRGFHTHQGLEEHHPALLQSMLDGIKLKLAHWGGKGLIFNIGGSYQTFSGPDLEDALSRLRTLFQVHIEPGRAIVRDAGFALAPVEKIVEDGDTLRIFTRLSFLSHLRWSRARFAGIFNTQENNRSFAQKKIVLEGSSCFEFDRSEIIHIDQPLTFDVGSLIVLEQITGYSVEWNKGFNGIEEAMVKFVGRRRPDSP